MNITGQRFNCIITEEHFTNSWHYNNNNYYYGVAPWICSGQCIPDNNNVLVDAQLSIQYILYF
jgi:hypothetical protein